MKQYEINYNALGWWEVYSAQLQTEYQQSLEEGLDVAQYKELFDAVDKLPLTAIKEQLADGLFQLVQNAPMRKDYPYNEPSSYEEIVALCDESLWQGGKVNESTLEDQIYGAWLARICGCMLGKTVEGIRTNELIPFLKETGNYPMHRYILSTDVNEETFKKYQFGFATTWYADKMEAMPADDDTNYMVQYQRIIEKYGRQFNPMDVATSWLSDQPKGAYCTAERVAFCNFVKGYYPPDSATYKNVFREWIGAQIRGDYFGYINPGDPKTAAEMAFRDASISHIKNGIYGEMFASAMIACAAVEKDMKKILLGGLSQVPTTSRLYEAVQSILRDHENGVAKEEVFARIHSEYDEYTTHGWCHTISNAMIVAACLLYGEGDYGKSICMAVETGFDTDCNGATVGSVLGIRDGSATVGREWSDPLHGSLDSAIVGCSRKPIVEYAKATMKHVKY